MLVQGEIGGLFLIRVKLNIFIFYPSTSSVWGPSRALQGKVMVQVRSGFRTHRFVGFMGTEVKGL